MTAQLVDDLPPRQERKVTPWSAQAEPAGFDVAVIQMRSRTGCWSDNMADASAQVRSLADKGSRIIVLPEFFACGYDLDMDVQAAAERVPGPTSAALSELARNTNTVLITAFIRRDTDLSIVDSSMVVCPDGTVTVGDKRFLWQRENSVFAAGKHSGLLVHTPFGTVGVVICYEAGFPETVRDLARSGAEVIAIPAAFGHDRLYVWQLLTRSRALENGVVVAAAGLTGQCDNGPRFAGHSVIVGPDGQVRAEMDDSVGSAQAEISRTALLAAREQIPYLADLTRLGGISGHSLNGVGEMADLAGLTDEKSTCAAGQER